MSDSELLLKILTQLGNLEKKVDKIEKLVNKSRFNIKIKNKQKQTDEEEVKIKSKKSKKSKKKSKKYDSEKIYNKKTLMTEYNDKLLLHGNTYEYRSIIKENGGFWNKDLKGWVLPLDSKIKISENIENIVTNVLEKNLEGDNSSTNKKSMSTIANHCLIDSDSD